MSSTSLCTCARIQWSIEQNGLLYTDYAVAAADLILSSLSSRFCGYIDGRAAML